jgi:hypothetical protein
VIEISGRIIADIYKNKNHFKKHLNVKAFKDNYVLKFNYSGRPQKAYKEFGNVSLNYIYYLPQS